MLTLLKKIFENWQILLTVIAGATSLWVNYANEERRHFEVNKQAIEVAEARTAPFLQQPGYVLTYLENAYPEHAYCAALSTMQACVSALDQAGSGAGVGVGADVGADVGVELASCLHQGGAEIAATDALSLSSVKIRAARDALGREIDVFAHRAGLSVAELSKAGQAEAGEACTGTLGDEVGKLGWADYLSYRRLSADCRETLALYKKTACNAEVRLAQYKAEARLAQSDIEEIPDVPSGATDGGMDGGAGGESGAGTGSETDPPDQQVAETQTGIITPANLSDLPQCIDKPLIFSHIGTDDTRDAARTLAALLDQLGWQTAGIEAVAGYRSSGDIRYYYPDQKDCAEVLRGWIEAQGVWPSLKLIYLGEAYSNLPRGRVELWLGPVRG